MSESKVYAFVEPDEAGEPRIIAMSTEEIRDQYYPYWYTCVCAKYGQEEVDKYMSFRDCVDDWILINGAWES